MLRTLDADLAMLNARTALEALRTSLGWLQNPPAEDARLPLDCRLVGSASVMGRALDELSRRLDALESELAR